MPLATAPLSDLFPLVRPHVQGCPNPLIVQELRMAAIDFCQKTKAWRERVTTAIYRQDRSVCPLDYAEIHEIEKAEFSDGSNTWPLQPVPFLLTDIEDRDTTTEGAPQYITQSAPDTVSILPFGTGTLTLHAIMKPQSTPKYGVSGTTTRQAIQNVIPTFLAAQYGEVLAHGALSRLLTMSGVPWAQPQLGAARYALYKAACDANSNMHVKGQHGARMRSASSWV